MLNEQIYLSPTVRVKGNTNRLGVVSQYQTEKLALFLYFSSLDIILYFASFASFFARFFSYILTCKMYLH